jgi:hypothetical protein
LPAAPSLAAPQPLRHSSTVQGEEGVVLSWGRGAGYVDVEASGGCQMSFAEARS